MDQTTDYALLNEDQLKAVSMERGLNPNCSPEQLIKNLEETDKRRAARLSREHHSTHETTADHHIGKEFFERVWPFVAVSIFLGGALIYQMHRESSARDTGFLDNQVLLDVAERKSTTWAWALGPVILLVIGRFLISSLLRSPDRLDRGPPDRWGYFISRWTTLSHQRPSTDLLGDQDAPKSAHVEFGDVKQPHVEADGERKAVVDLKAEIRRLGDELSGFKDMEGMFQQDSDRLRREKASLEQEIANLRRKVTSLENKITIKEEVDALRQMVTSLAERTTTEEEADVLRHKVSSLEEERDQLTKDLSRCRKEKNKFERDHVIDDHIIGALRNEGDLLREARDKLCREITQCGLDKVRLNRKITELREELNKTERDLRFQITRVNDLTEELCRFKDVYVVARFREPMDYEWQQPLVNCRFPKYQPGYVVLGDEDGTDRRDVKSDPRNFMLDYVFKPTTSNRHLDVVVLPLIGATMKIARDLCMIFDGRAGCGKSYTMVNGPNAVGLTAADLIFTWLKASGTPAYSVKYSAVELYNHRRLELPDTSRSNVADAQQLRELMSQTQHSRHTATTEKNRTSSRSHLIWTVTLFPTDRRTSGLNDIDLTFVDLADVERMDGEYMCGALEEEDRFINESRSALHGKLEDRVKKGQVMPQGNLLTEELEKYLCNKIKSNIVLLALLSPFLDEVNNTLQTLDFAHKIYKLEEDRVLFKVKY